MAGALAFGVPAHASTIQVTFDYSGTGSGGITATGSGSFSFDSSKASNITLGDLLSFSFSDTITSNQTYQFTYGLADLTSFNATSTISGTDAILTALSLATRSQNALNNSATGTFTVTSLGNAGAATSPGNRSTTGTVQQTNTPPPPPPLTVPEPSSALLTGVFGLGLLAVSFARRKRSA